MADDGTRTDPSDADHDVLVIGGGPAGSLTAYFLAAEGLDVALVERDEFPRFHIGESMSGEARRILHEAGLADVIDEASFPRKTGTVVYNGTGQSSFYMPVMGRSEQGDLTPSRTWQVERSRFDALLLDRAVQAGVSVRRASAQHPILDGSDPVGVTVSEDDAVADIRARHIVDASGRHAFLSRHGVASRRKTGTWATQTAIFTHVTGTSRDDDYGDDTRIFYAGPDRWAWFIPIGTDLVSIGIVVPNTELRAAGQEPEDFYRTHLSTFHESLSPLVPEVHFAEPVRTAANYSYEIEQFVGPNWLCVGDAHRFVDPIFSFGLTIAVGEAAHASRAVLRSRAGDTSAIAEFGEIAAAASDIVEDLVHAFWARPVAFGVWAHHRHHEDFVDLFAGRIFEHPGSRGLDAIRAVERSDRSVAS